MTSEVEVPSVPKMNFGSSKVAALLLFLDIFQKESSENELIKVQISLLIQVQGVFHENFYMFPLSNKRMIVLINPFFKFMKTMDSRVLSEIHLSNFSMLPRWDVFDVNESQYKMTEDLLDGRSLKDPYVYHPVKLWHEELVYCNALFLDRVHEWLGFTSLSSVKDSVIEYDIVDYVRNDYTELHKLISKL